MTENKKLFIEIFILVLVLGNVFFAYNYFTTERDLRAIKATEAKAELNTKVINFTAMFINKVLQADKEVDFETRLSLENAVRELKDEEVMAEWQNFTSSKTEADAQNSVKKLLGILVSKIQK
jgi:hypothetical protein